MTAPRPRHELHLHEQTVRSGAERDRSAAHTQGPNERPGRRANSWRCPHDRRICADRVRREREEFPLIGPGRQQLRSEAGPPRPTWLASGSRPPARYWRESGTSTRSEWPQPSPFDTGARRRSPPATSYVADSPKRETASPTAATTHGHHPGSATPDTTNANVPTEPQRSSPLLETTALQHRPRHVVTDAHDPETMDLGGHQGAITRSCAAGTTPTPDSSTSRFPGAPIATLQPFAPAT